MKTKILQVPIINVEFQDELCWRHTTNGDCTTKSAYKVFLHDQISVTSNARRCFTDAKKSILLQAWKNNHLPPRIKTFAWRLIRRVLATGKRASRFSTRIKKECSRCGLPETDAHLFFHCHFSRAVWFSSPLGFRTDFYEQYCYPSNFIECLLASLYPAASVHCIFATLWMLWKARNDLLFNRKEWSISQVICAAKAVLSTGDADDIAVPSDNLATTRIHAPPFSQPPGAVIYCNAAYNRDVDASTAGLGVYLHDPVRNIKLFVSAISTDASSALQAEAQGLLLAVWVVQLMEWRRVCFLSDSKTLVDAVATDNLLSRSGHWVLRPFLADAQNHRNSSGNLVQKVSRADNKTAHALCKRAYRDRSDPRTTFRCKSNLLFSSHCASRNRLCNITLKNIRLLAVHCLSCSSSLPFGRHQALGCLSV
uniref:Uncharacterized protein n=1 Tax=Avena sativa TaxID=4498 RepID=A0ACD5VTL4_AVESA